MALGAQAADHATEQPELNANLGAENGRAAIGSPAPGEIVFAVQYRKVRYNWFSSRKMKDGFLNVECNRWKVFPITGRTQLDHEDDDIVEAILQDSIVEEYIEDGEIYNIGNQIIRV